MCRCRITKRSLHRRSALPGAIMLAYVPSALANGLGFSNEQFPVETGGPRIALLKIYRIIVAANDSKLTVAIAFKAKPKLAKTPACGSI